MKNTSKQEELRKQVRSIKLPDTTVYSTKKLVVGSLVDKSLENQIMELISAARKEAAIEELAKLDQAYKWHSVETYSGFKKWRANRLKKLESK